MQRESIVLGADGRIVCNMRKAAKFKRGGEGKGEKCC